MNFPTPTFRMFDEYPAIRASTLATLELVSTVPETICPPRATGVLMDIVKMRGGALAGIDIGLIATTCGAKVAATIGCPVTALAGPVW